MKDFFKRPLQSNDGSLTFVGFCWMMAIVLVALFSPMILLQRFRAYNIGMRRGPKVGDIIFWGPSQIPGILVKRFDMYARRGESEPYAFDGEPSDYPSYCWHISWPSDKPTDYNERYGALELNLMNLRFWKKEHQTS